MRYFTAGDCTRGLASASCALRRRAELLRETPTVAPEQTPRRTLETAAATSFYKLVDVVFVVTGFVWLENVLVILDYCRVSIPRILRDERDIGPRSERNLTRDEPLNMLAGWRGYDGSVSCYPGRDSSTENFGSDSGSEIERAEHIPPVHNSRLRRYHCLLIPQPFKDEPLRKRHKKYNKRKLTKKKHFGGPLKDKNINQDAESYNVLWDPRWRYLQDPPRGGRRRHLSCGTANLSRAPSRWVAEAEEEICPARRGFTVNALSCLAINLGAMSLVTMCKLPQIRP
ncbi:hypothetical protein AAG570_009121 [Ranatra chinensis]|uniref:Uncharacterized protein n=1 Tax=Ranatra chinensis TaxID=642074 RepID=A0ABD0YT62_9HEMI